MFTIRDLSTPIIQAPMAGGPSTPALAAAVSAAGGLGFLAAGYRSAEVLAAQIERTRELTAAPFGVNLFVPQVGAVDPRALDAYLDELRSDADRFGTAPGVPRADDDDWRAKLEVVLESRPAIVSFTFGSPSAAETGRLHAAGVAVATTVTTLEEAREAAARGADTLIVQGPDAGGHRGTWDPDAEPGIETVTSLLRGIRTETELPLVASGGIATAHFIDHVQRLGASAVQLGTAFLLADEAGTNPVHRAALVSPAFEATVLTRAFSGRWARGLANGFTRAHEATAPSAYPQVHHATAPIRAAAVAAGDPDFTNLWAGTAYGLAREAPAASILSAMLEGDLG